MTCTHSKADTQAGRIAMLFSADGVGCYECNSRIGLPLRVRLKIFGILALPYVAIVLDQSGTVVALVGGLATAYALHLGGRARLWVTSPSERSS